MKVILLSDPHFSLGQVTSPSPENLESAIMHINNFHSDAECCIIPGDLVDNGTEKEYREFSARLAHLEMPCHLTIGNHDNRQSFRNVFGRQHADANGYIQSAVDIGDLCFLLIDTNLHGREYGNLDSVQLEWLQEKLCTACKPCCICMHHPPLPTGLPAFDAIGLRCNAFRKLLRRHNDVIRMILHGHCHMPLSGELEGIPVSGLTSLANQALPNFTDNAFISNPAPSIFYHVMLTEGRSCILHLINCPQSANPRKRENKNAKGDLFPTE